MTLPACQLGSLFVACRSTVSMTMDQRQHRNSHSVADVSFPRTQDTRKPQGQNWGKVCVLIIFPYFTPLVFES